MIIYISYNTNVSESFSDIMYIYSFWKIILYKKDDLIGYCSCSQTRKTEILVQTAFK